MRIYRKQDFEKLGWFLKEFGEGDELEPEGWIRSSLYEKDTEQLITYYLKYFRENLNERLDIISTYGIDSDLFFGETDIIEKEIAVSYQQILIMVCGYYVDNRFQLNEVGKRKIQELESYKGLNRELTIRVEEKGIRIQTDKIILKDDIEHIFNQVVNKLHDVVEAYDMFIR